MQGLFDGAAGVARGERYGTPVAFNAILVTLGHRNFVDAIEGLEAGLRRVVISRPTTQQLLDDCAREVRDTLMPLIADPAVQRPHGDARAAAHLVRRALGPRDRLDGRRVRGDGRASRPPWPTPIRDAAIVGDLRGDYLEAASRRRTRCTSTTVCVSTTSPAGPSATRSTWPWRGTPSSPAAREALIHARVDREADCRPGFYFPGRS